MTHNILLQLVCITATPLPAATQLDGVDLLPFLTGSRTNDPHDMLFWKSYNGGAVRQGDWKLVIEPSGKHSLFHLGEDLGETNDLADIRPAKVEELLNAFQQWSKNFPVSVRERAKAKKKPKR